jgi:Ni/Fe-hydrogenase b-type cytochrome subunit
MSQDTLQARAAIPETTDPSETFEEPPRGLEKRHHWVVRLTHWVNVAALAVMVTSGLRIFNAYPAFAPRGGTFCCYPFAGRPFDDWLTFGGWLAGARHWHFAAMWVLVANGLLYLGFVYLHGEWRDLVPRRRDPRDAWEMVKFYFFVRKEHPRGGKHNTLQKLAYFSAPVLMVIVIATGLAIWKPVQLGWLTRLMGGYVWARYWHFLTMLALVALTFVHVFMVLSVDPYSIPSMITGRYRADRSPERRNGRPFYHLFPRRSRPSGEVPGAAFEQAELTEPRAAAPPHAGETSDGGGEPEAAAESGAAREASAGAGEPGGTTEAGAAEEPGGATEHHRPTEPLE